jgi:predicted nucleotidyltransferase
MKELSGQLLDEIVRRVSGATHPRRIYLFGSHAGGAPDIDSDIDLLAVVPDQGADCRQLARLGRRSLWGMCVPVDLIVCTEADMAKWSDVECSLLHTVATKGRVVYDAES